MSTTGTTATPQEKLRACLNLMRRLPPHQQKENLEGLLQLVSPDVGDELAVVDVPLEEAIDPATVRVWYERVGDRAGPAWVCVIDCA